MVPKVMPRNRCERSLTQSKNLDTPLEWMSAKLFPRISSQVSFRLSHISIVMAPRCALAFSRATWSDA